MFKKLLFASLLAGTMATGAHAQGFYVKGGLGYAFPAVSSPSIGGDDLAVSQTYNNATNKWTSVKYINSSFGKGINLNITPGYSFNEYLAAELDINVLFSPKQTVYEQIENGDPVERVDLKNQRQVKNSIFLTPALVVSAGGESKLKPYAKFGLVMPLGNKIVANYAIAQTTGGKNIDNNSTEEITTNFNLGFMGGIGGCYALNDKLSLYAEITLTALKQTSKKKVTTALEYKEDGKVVKTLADLTVREKETIYTKEISYTDNSHLNASFDKNKPFNALAQSYNFSSVALRFGVKMNFGGSK